MQAWLTYLSLVELRVAGTLGLAQSLTYGDGICSLNKEIFMWVTHFDSKCIEVKKSLGDHLVDDFYGRIYQLCSCLETFKCSAPFAWNALPPDMAPPLTCHMSLFKRHFVSEASIGYSTSARQLLNGPQDTHSLVFMPLYNSCLLSVDRT